MNNERPLQHFTTAEETPAVKRSHFFVFAALVPALFGSVMMVAPDLMLRSSLVTYSDATKIVAQWVGFGVFSLALINFLSRGDSGSPALRAVMIGNLVFHALGIGFDTYGYLAGFVTQSGLVTGLVPHAILALGFLYYLSHPSTRP